MTDAMRPVAGHGSVVGPFKWTPTGMSVTRDATIEEWTAAMRWAQTVERASLFWLGDLLAYGERHYGDLLGQATELHMDYGRIRNLIYVAERVPLSRRRDNVVFALHQEVAPLPPAEQALWLEKCARDGMTRAQLRTALRLSRRHEHYAAGALPPGQFRVVYADPPWAYNDSGVIVASDAYGRAERHYPTMSIEALCALPVQDAVEDNAVLFLWVTSPLLSACWPVITAWGFTYKTSMVWNKSAHNYGHYVSVRHEMLLICTRGSCTPDQPTPMPESVQTIRRAEHSEKPQEFRAVIEHLYPLGRRLELFGRKPVEGWTVYGNQLGVGRS